jgi:hypothetical protein
MPAWYCLQDDLQYLEADESKNLDFLAGGGAPPADGLEHFPCLWCPNGTYSAHGQLFLVPLSQARVYSAGCMAVWMLMGEEKRGWRGEGVVLRERARATKGAHGMF